MESTHSVSVVVKQLIKYLPDITYIRSIFNDASMQSQLSLCISSYNSIINAKANSKSLLLTSALQDKLYEQLNTGHWSNVDENYRKAYTLTIFLKVLHYLLMCDTKIDDKTLEKCLYELDLGLLLGCPLNIDEKSIDLLNIAIETLEQHKQPMCSHSNNAKRQKIDKPTLPTTMDIIPSVVCPSLEEFKCKYFDSLKPVLLKNCIDHWPAMKKWNDPVYLISVAGNRTVPIEIGENYTSNQWSQDLVNFQKFILRQYTDSDDPFNRIEYLAQHNLFDQITALRQDICVPEYCCLSTSSSTSSTLLPDIKAWLGPIGTVSPLHYDPKHNLLCQVVGMKLVILAAPNDTMDLYAHSGEMLKNTSKIDAEQLDFDQFPLLKNVKFYSAILDEGDMLYIPVKWWHYVRSLSKSFSVSFWWE